MEDISSEPQTQDEDKIVFGLFLPIESSNDDEYRHVLERILETVATKNNPNDWRDVARNSGTHALKVTDARINAKSGQVVTFGSSVSYDEDEVATYSNNGALVGLAKALMARVRHPGDNRAAALVDHIGTAHPAAAIFSELFPPEIVQAVVEGREERARAADVTRIASVHVKNVFLPDGKRGYVSATPVHSNTAFTALVRLFKERAPEESIPSITTKIGAKSQNASLHVSMRGGVSRRLFAQTPMPPTSATRAVLRFCASGRLPTGIVSREDVVTPLLGLSSLLSRRDTYTNADIEQAILERTNSYVGIVTSVALDFLDGVEDERDRLPVPVADEARALLPRDEAFDRDVLVEGLRALVIATIDRALGRKGIGAHAGERIASFLRTPHGRDLLDRAIERACP